MNRPVVVGRDSFVEFVGDLDAFAGDQFLHGARLDALGPADRQHREANGPFGARMTGIRDPPFSQNLTVVRPAIRPESRPSSLPDVQSQGRSQSLGVIFGGEKRRPMALKKGLG